MFQLHVNPLPCSINATESNNCKILYASREQKIFWWILLHPVGLVLGQLMDVVASSRVSSQLLKGIKVNEKKVGKMHSDLGKSTLSDKCIGINITFLKNYSTLQSKFFIGKIDIIISFKFYIKIRP